MEIKNQLKLLKQFFISFTNVLQIAGVNKDRLF